MRYFLLHWSQKMHAGDAPTQRSFPALSSPSLPAMLPPGPGCRRGRADGGKGGMADGGGDDDWSTIFGIIRSRSRPVMNGSILREDLDERRVR